MSNARCSTCRAPIRWTVTEHGKAMPVDYAPVRGGNIVLRDEGTRAVAVYVAPLLESDDDKARPHYVSHFVTCPQAAQHRRKAS